MLTLLRATVNFEILPSDKGLIKAWVKDLPVEASAQQQLRNIASLPFIYKHVAVMPDVHWGVGATIGSVIATKGAVIPAAVGVDLGCFVGETRIPLLDGTQATLLSLSERADSFWVYSVDKNKKIVPGKAVCVKTRSNTSLVKVVVSGGEEVFCTPDHKFMLYDGSFIEAQHLKMNDSLMPLYRKWQARDGYESVSNGKGASVVTHKMVWKFFNKNSKTDQVIHHVNHVHFDNRPENLLAMTNSQHSKHHRKTGKSFDNSSESFQVKRRAGVKKRTENKDSLQLMKDVGKKNIINYMRDRPEHFANATSQNGLRGAPYLRAFNTSPLPCKICGEQQKNPATLLWHNKKLHQSNHKVISVTPLDYKADVYCLQVEEHHNFALAAGVFVHNCGMQAQRTSLVASDLPDNLSALRSLIESKIPHGRTNNGAVGDRGAWGTISDDNALILKPELQELKLIAEKHPEISRAAERAAFHAGTLGGGNHFVELCIDEEQRVWIMLHSGSRGIGNRIGTHFIEAAKKDMKRWFINLPDEDLAYIPEGSELFTDYVEAVSWAQGFAKTNRNIMMKASLSALYETVSKPFTCDCEAISCHHNYISKERHFGENVLVTRKGAVDAHEGEMGIIPGSMGARSFIVRGKGNRESFCSCSHGAGRVMSRNEAKKTFSVQDHINATEGVECRKDEGVVDETPKAYKDIDKVMQAQSDLVEIVHTLKQVLCVKG
jgi:tRNA-splicing ligase RtcB (3'-phosphate/5'-hydroxy nucleic acid ligase)